MAAENGTPAKPAAGADTPLGGPGGFGGADY